MQYDSHAYARQQQPYSQLFILQFTPKNIDDIYVVIRYGYDS